MTCNTCPELEKRVEFWYCLRYDVEIFNPERAGYNCRQTKSLGRSEKGVHIKSDIPTSLRENKTADTSFQDVSKEDGDAKNYFRSLK